MNPNTLPRFFVQWIWELSDEKKPDKVLALYNIHRDSKNVIINGSISFVRGEVAWQQGQD